MSHALGVRLLETDVQVTCDGVALAFHDTTLGRLTGVRGKVSDYTWNELKAVRVEGEPLLRLDELLTTFNDSAFLVDVKAPSAITATVNAIRTTASADRVCVAGGMDAWLQAVTDETGCQRSMGFKALTALMTAAKLGVRPPSGVFANVTAAHLPTRLLGLAWMACPSVSARLTESIHERGLLVRTWTVNDADDMTRFLRLGVDAIITDHPDVLRTVMIREGLWRASAARHGTPARAPHSLNRTPAASSTESSTTSPALSA